MRIFLITLGMSIVGTIVLWQLGVADRIWPAHPLLATSLIIGGCAAGIQVLLAREAAARKAK